MKAVWNGKVIAESDETIIIEGNHYFPPNAVHREYLHESDTHTTCPWKGLAYYYNLVVEGQTNQDAAWYPKPKDGSIQRVGKNFSNYIAFWHGVTVS